ncbi:hypothetical protein [Sabulibacter ruber]|nr:hypothetical protein [Sabulibacter ruber]
MAKRIWQKRDGNCVTFFGVSSEMCFAPATSFLGLLSLAAQAINIF